MENKGLLPTRVQAGETIWVASANTAQSRADIIIDGYLPASYTLAYQFAGASPVTVAGVANGGGTGWTLEVTAAATLAWKPGTISFAGYVTQTATARVFAVDAGTIIVDPSPLSTSSWTAVVAACDAAILAYAGGGMRSFSLDGMSYSFNDMSELTTLRAYAQNMADQETGGRMARVIRSRFT